MKINRCLSLSLLFFCLLVDASEVVHAQQKEQKDSSSVTAGKNTCTNAERKKLSVKCKDRYFFGEAPAIKIVITNTSRSPQTLKEAEYEKFSLEMTGLFNDELQKKTGAYDGRWDIPKEPTKPALPGKVHVFEALSKREPKFVTLAPGESTTLELNLSKTFGAYLGMGKYQLAVKSEDGQKIVKEFEVYFDDEKSVPLLAGMLKSDDDGERNWSVIKLAEFKRPKLIAVLEELVTAGNEKQREFASERLTQIKAGWFDHLKLRVEAKDRYFLGETPILAISIVSNSSTIQTVKQAQYQKFSLELVGVFVPDGKQETKTCVFDGSQDTSKRSLKPQAQGNPQLVELSESQSTTLSLNLSECFHSPFGVGKYELTVKSDDPQQVFKDQKVVKKFEVYFEKTSPDNQ
jgi:hypothetical protein